MKIIKTLFLVLIFDVSKAGITVTFQDYLILNEDTLVLSNRPLDSYFDLYPHLMPEVNDPYIHANNQYTAYFEIEDSTFYLIAIYSDKIDSSSSSGLKNLIEDIFNTSKRVKMNWFSTTLVFGTSVLGTSIRVHGHQRREKFFVAMIDAGDVLSIRLSKTRNIKRLRHQLFKEFCRTPDSIILHEEIFNTSNFKPKAFERYLGNRVFDITSEINKENTLHNSGYN